MNLIKKTLLGFLIGIGIYGAVIEVIGLFFSEDRMAYTLGVLLGLFVAVILMLHIAYTLDKALDMPEKQATGYTTKQSLIRLAIMLVAMVIAIYLSKVNFVATILGMLGLKMGSFIASPVLKKIYPDDFITKPDEGTPDSM